MARGALVSVATITIVTELFPRFPWSASCRQDGLLVKGKAPREVHDQCLCLHGIASPLIEAEHCSSAYVASHQKAASLEAQKLQIDPGNRETQLFCDLLRVALAVDGEKQQDPGSNLAAG